jgi:hypothetical protein
MGKKKEDSFLNDYQKIKNEMVFEKVDNILKNQIDNYPEALEEIGFAYYEEENFEEKEENEAMPQNSNQKYLVSYFDGKTELSEKTLQIFEAERNAQNPNYPLIRKYFKKANKNLKTLILYGLDQQPTHVQFLCDLAYYHEFENLLKELISRFNIACSKENNLLNFSEIAQEFYYATSPDGYDALCFLKELFPPHTEKGKNIRFIIAELIKENDKSQHINF